MRIAVVVCFSADRAFFSHFRQHKTALLKRVRAVRVEQDRRTDSAFPHRVLDSRESDFKTLRVGREWQK